jgi:hypothetical protein
LELRLNYTDFTADVIKSVAKSVQDRLSSANMADNMIVVRVPKVWFNIGRPIMREALELYVNQK